jgi:hypothetical protein
MRPSPSFDLTLRAFGLWHAGVGALLLLAAAVALAWWVTVPAPIPGATILAALLAVACLGAAALGSRPVPPTRIRWDGQRWLTGPHGPAGDDLAAADLSVAIDLGVWMLLRLRRPDASRWRGIAWLPAQRRGHAAQWHALRCAVYSPRPAVGAPPGVEP